MFNIISIIMILITVFLIGQTSGKLLLYSHRISNKEIAKSISQLLFYFLMLISTTFIYTYNTAT